MTETAGVVVQLRANVAELEKGMQRAQRALDRAASQMERRSDRFSRKFERDLTNSARESAKAFEEAFAAEKSFGQLEQSLNPAIAALRRYEAAQETVKRAVESGMVSQQRAAGVLAQAQGEYQRAVAAINGVGGSLTSSGAQYRQFGQVIQQAGFQVGDFAVQVASGQGVLRPFIQQGTQLISMFGPWGAVIGAAGAVVGALAVSFLGAGEEAQSFQDALDELESASRDLKGFNEQVATLDALQDKYGEVTEEVFALIAAMRQLELEKQAQAAANALATIGEAINAILAQTPLEQAGQRGGGFLIQLRELQAAFQALEGAQGFKAQADAAAQLRASVQDMLDGPMRALVERTAPDLVTELLKAEDALRQAARATGEVRPEMEAVADGAADVESNLSGAVGQASSLANELNRAASALNRMAASAQDRLARAQAALQFRNDPVGLERANAQREAGQAVAEVQAAASQIGIPSGLVPKILEPIKQSARETVEALTEVARVEAEISRLNKIDQKSRSGGNREAKERERAAEAIQKEITGLNEKLAKLDQERSLLVQRAQLQDSGASPESIARAEAVLTAELTRQNVVRELLNKAKQEEVELTPQQIAEIEKQAQATKDLTLANYDLESAIKKQGDAAAEAAKRQEDLARGVADVADRFTRAITQADSFADALKNIAVELANLAVQGLSNQGPFAGLLGGIIPSLIGGAFGSFAPTTSPIPIPRPAAKGMALSAGNVIPFARGGIVSQPTIFPMARGAGLMGEAGPEAILPLRRGANGRLGVQAAGGGGRVLISLAPGLRAEFLDEAARQSVVLDRQAQADTLQKVPGVAAAGFDRRPALRR